MLRLACQSRQVSIVRYLLEGEENPQRLFEDQVEIDYKSVLWFVLLVCGSFQKSPSVLMVAADSDAAECVTLLLNHHASVKEVDERGYNALCRAILNEKK